MEPFEQSHSTQAVIHAVMTAPGADGSAAETQLDAYMDKLRQKNFLLRDVGKDLCAADMPAFLPDRQREVLLSTYPEARRTRIASDAFCYEVMGRPVYWKKVVHDLKGIFGKDSPRGYQRIAQLDENGRRIQFACADHAIDQMLSRDPVEGSARSAELFSALAALPGLEVTEAERDKLLSHGLFNGRQFNSACATFETAMSSMPPEAASLIETIRQDNRQPETMHLVKAMSASEPFGLRRKLLSVQDEALESAMTQNGKAAPAKPGTPEFQALMTERAKLAAARRMMRQASGDLATPETIGKAHRSIISLGSIVRPFGPHLVAGQIALNEYQALQARRQARASRSNQR